MEALRQILAVFSVNNDSLKKGLTEGNKLVDEFRGGLNALIGPLTAVFSGAAVVGFTSHLLNAASATRNLSDSLGIGLSELQEWQHAANVSSVDVNQLNVAITKLAQKIGQAKSGNAELTKTFKDLGIDVKELASLAEDSLSDAFEFVALQLSGVEDTAKRTDLALKLFEESGPKLHNIFKAGASGVAEMRAEVHELGAVFDQRFAASADEVTGNLTRLNIAGKGLLIQIIKPLLPEMVKFSQQIVKVSKALVPLAERVGEFLRSVDVKRIALAATALVAAGNVAKLGEALKMVTGAAARFLLPLMAIEDVIGFLSGDDSFVGAKLDQWFDEGTAERVRTTILKFVDDVVAMFRRFRDEVLPEVRQFASDVVDKFTSVGKDVVGFAEEWGPAISKIVGSLTAAVIAVKAVSVAMAAWTALTGAATAAMGSYTAATVLWTLKGAIMQMLFGKLKAAAALFNATLWANPIAMWAALIVGALALVIAFWPQISGFFTKLWEHIKVIGSSIGDWLTSVWERIRAGWQSFTERAKAAGDWLLAAVKVIFTSALFAGEMAASGLADAFGIAWNTILEGAKRVMGVYAKLASFIPGIGDMASKGISDLAGQLDGLTVKPGAVDATREKYADIREALKVELESAAARMGGGETTAQKPGLPQYTAPQQQTVNTTNVNNDVRQSATVHVTVPPGTPAAVANGVSRAAQRGTQQGMAGNLRATQEALVPRPAG